MTENALLLTDRVFLVECCPHEEDCHLHGSSDCNLVNRDEADCGFDAPFPKEWV